jgi:hypothetical protein
MLKPSRTQQMQSPHAPPPLPTPVLTNAFITSTPSLSTVTSNGALMAPSAPPSFISVPTNTTTNNNNNTMSNNNITGSGIGGVVRLATPVRASVAMSRTTTPAGTLAALAKNLPHDEEERARALTALVLSTLSRPAPLSFTSSLSSAISSSTSSMMGGTPIITASSSMGGYGHAHGVGMTSQQVPLTSMNASLSLYSHGNGHGNGKENASMNHTNISSASTNGVKPLPLLDVSLACVKESGMGKQPNVPKTPQSALRRPAQPVWVP